MNGLLRRAGPAREPWSAPCRARSSSVLVATGDTVSVGQVLCVVEAMKMENEIDSPHEGRVGQLAVVPGQGVASGQLICVVEGAE